MVRISRALEKPDKWGYSNGLYGSTSTLSKREELDRIVRTSVGACSLRVVVWVCLYWLRALSRSKLDHRATKSVDISNRTHGISQDMGAVLEGSFMYIWEEISGRPTGRNHLITCTYIQRLFQSPY